MAEQVTNSWWCRQKALPNYVLYILATVKVVLIILSIVFLVLFITKPDKSCPLEKAVDHVSTASPATFLTPSTTKAPISFDVYPSAYRGTLRMLMPGYGDRRQKRVWTFEADMDLTMVTLKKTRVIHLLAKNLTFVYCSLFKVEQGMTNSMKIGRMEVDKETGTIRLMSDDDLKVESEYLLKLKFRGNIYPEGSDGISVVTNGKNDNTPTIITNNMVNGMSRVLPCVLNKPTTLTLTVIHPRRTMCVTNSKDMATVDIDATTAKTTFETTPYMNLDMFLLAITNNQFSEQITTKNTVIRIFHQGKKSDGFDKAAEIALMIMNHYEALFERRYPANKQDFIALPNSTVQGFWGLLTLDSNLLETAGIDQVEADRIRTILSREMARLWLNIW